jgi:predicted nucleic acid-binding protein
MQYDTDVLIWLLRGNQKAGRLLTADEDRSLSVVSYMELLQGARDKKEVRVVQDFLGDLGFRVLPLTENIGHRALVYIEEYALRAGLCVADALIAATAVEGKRILCTANQRHYRVVNDLNARHFVP